jgi:hypothetical protein
MPRALRPIETLDAAQAIRLDVPPAELRRFARDFIGTVWDNVTSMDADYLMLTAASCRPDGCWVEFVAMREVDGPVNWREAYRYVGNPLDLSRPRG